MKTRVTEGQNIIDLTLQHYASVEGLFELATLNGLSVTDTLTAGQELKLPDLNPADSTPERNAYQSRSQRVNTGQQIALDPELGDYNNDFTNDFN